MEFENDTQRVMPIKTRQSEQSPTPRATRWFALAATVLVVVLGIGVFAVMHANHQGYGPGATRAITLPAGARLALPATWEITSSAIIADNDIWSVGAIKAANGYAYGGDALILHYSDGQWHVVSSGDYANSALESIAMLSATEGWAVGYIETKPRVTESAGSPLQQTSLPLILHYHDGVWKKAATPSFVGTLYNVQIGSTDEGVAYGYDINDAPTVLLHYKAGVWSNDIVAPEKNSGASGEPAYTVTGASGIWTYGDHGVYHLQGNGWQLVGSNPDTLLSQSGIEDIAVTGPKDVWALLINGVASSGSKRTTKIAHYDGHTWSLVAMPSDILPAGLSVDRFIPHTTTWLDVSRVNDTTHLAEDLLVHRENGQWTVSNSPFNYLLAVKDTTATQSIAVGATFKDGFGSMNILHYQNGAWS